MKLEKPPLGSARISWRAERNGRFVKRLQKQATRTFTDPLLCITALFLTFYSAPMRKRAGQQDAKRRLSALSIGRLGVRREKAMLLQWVNMAEHHGAGGQVEPHVARLGQLLQCRNR